MNKTSCCLVLIPLLTMLSACERQAEATFDGRAAGFDREMLMAQAPATRSAPAPQTAASEKKTLAYEHVVTVELAREVLAAHLQAVQDACNTRQDYGCTLLDVQSSMNNDVPYGSVRMRLAPGGVDALIVIAGKDGKVTGRNTHAEDLAEPVADTERELALLTTHRDRLQEFLKSKELKIEQLITVSKELASVQTQIDALGTRAANLRRRIDTELLTINFSVPFNEQAAAQSPILDALRSFGSEFKHAIAQVITFFAVVLPWLVVIVPGVILLRLFWRRVSLWLSRREAQAS